MGLYKLVFKFFEGLGSFLSRKFPREKVYYKLFYGRKNMKNEKNIYKGLESMGVSVFTYREIDSTNSEAKRYALSGGSAPAVFIADGQTAGRGRMGRSFYSPADTGIYLSLLLPAPDSAENTVRMTTAAALAAHDAIFDVLGIDTGIKWVNDLYLDGKKISGILAESFFVGSTRHVIIGIGINLSTKDFPEELRDKAGSLADRQNGEIKHRLTAAVAEYLYREMRELDSPTIIERYKRHSAVLGKSVVFTENQKSFSGVAEDVDEQGALLVRLPDGSIYRLGSGEISLSAVPTANSRCLFD